MAQIITHKGNVRTKPAISKNLISDWDSLLYSYWLEKIASSPGFYDDARESHMSGLCSVAVPVRLPWRFEKRNDS
jgi:hypothetical protein